MTNRPSQALVTAFEHAKLFRLVHETILSICGKHDRVTAYELSRLYDGYLGWMEDLPQSIREVDGKPEALPHVLFLQ